jgi:RHS repeat-associated protein
MTAIGDVTRRGYTEHSMLDNIGLIHMNGRMQDPLLGRFVSPDNEIPTATNTQGWNRYSYVYNRVLTHADSSGHIPLITVYGSNPSAVNDTGIALGFSLDWYVTMTDFCGDLSSLFESQPGTECIEYVGAVCTNCVQVVNLCAGSGCPSPIQPPPRIGPLPVSSMPSMQELNFLTNVGSILQTDAVATSGYEGELTFDYMNATKFYLTKYGKPVAFYGYKHTVFRVNKRPSIGGTGMTQYGRALHQLGIEILCANSPAAKGRVERAHSTLQDRLVKEMRVLGVSTMADANDWIDTYTETYKLRFADEPQLPVDVRRPLQPMDDLDDIFTWRDERALSRSLTLQYDKVLYAIDSTLENQNLDGRRVTVIDYADNRLKVRFGNRDLE